MGVALASPYLAFRQPVYIVAGFAGILALVFMVAQPLLAAGLLPGLGPVRSRSFHIGMGIATILAVLVHVGGLWIVSPPDVIDALLFRSPTPFSAWGVIALGALFAAALIALLRWRFRARTWRLSHAALVTLAVLATVPHAWLIEGAMGWVSKAALLAASILTLIWALRERRTLRLFQRAKPSKRTNASGGVAASTQKEDAEKA
ncbi:MAG: ferric reductase-like transmembrane domain-containing protein [Pseudomonadota bacterium]